MPLRFPKGVHLQQLLFNPFIKSCCDYIKSLLWHRLYQAIRLPILPESFPLVSQRSGSDFQVGSQRCRCLISSLSITIVNEHVVLQISLISHFILPHLIQAFLQQLSIQLNFIYLYLSICLSVYLHTHTHTHVYAYVYVCM